MAKINEDIFKDFCNDLGIKSIEEFEGGTMMQQRARLERMMELKQLTVKIQNKISKLRTTEESLKASMEQNKKNALKLKEETGQLLAKEKKSKEAIKAAMDSKEEEVRKRAAIKKDIDEQDKQLRNVQSVLKIKVEERDSVLKQIDKVESNMERLDAQRKSVLEQCLLEELTLPKKGRKSVEGDGEERDEMDVDEGNQATSQPSQSAAATKARQDITGACLDYSVLKRELKRDMDEKERTRVHAEMEEERKSIMDTIASMNPNMKAMEQLKEVQVHFVLRSPLSFS